MKAVVFRIPEDNFSDLHAQTFPDNDELWDFCQELCCSEIVEIAEYSDIDELEASIISRLDECTPNWELDGIGYFINGIRQR